MKLTREGRTGELEGVGVGNIFIVKLFLVLVVKC